MSASRNRVLAGVVAAAALALGNSLAAPTVGPAHPTLRAGVTSLRFSAEILADLGIELAQVTETSAPLREGALGFALDAAASRAVFPAAGGDFEAFDAADLRHAGGFALRLRGATVDLAGFRLAEAAAPYVLELRDARDRRWLLVDRPHAHLASAELSLSDADVLIAPELARLLGRPDLSATYIGALDAQLSLEPAPDGATPMTAAPGGSCVGDFSQPIDLLLVELTGMTQAARENAGRVALAPAATVRNLGPGDVQWYRAIAPSTPVGPHPYLALHFYRLSGGVLEQIGRADLKHAYYATNTGCGCPGGQILYVGCDDLYGVNTNLDRFNLAPRDELDAFALTWTSLGSHFDALPVDDYRDHEGNADHDDYEHRLVVMEPDLATPGARFFYEAWYLAPGDTELGNSMGHRETAPALQDSTWSFPTVDTGTVNGSILDVFVDPQNVQPGEATELLDTGEGRVHLAVVTTDLGGGVFHYEYALLNFDFERQIQSFSLPVGPGHTVSNAGFGDADGDPQNDWTPSVANFRITWTAPPGHALDWGTLFNFRIDVAAAPVQTAAILSPLEAGSPQEVFVPTLPEPGGRAQVGSALVTLALLARRRSRRGCR